MVKIPLQDLKCAVSGFASSRLPKSAADKEPAKKTGASQDRKLPHAAPLPSPFPVVCRCSFRMGLAFRKVPFIFLNNSTNMHKEKRELPAERRFRPKG
jgi:hypothetical protein